MDVFLTVVGMAIAMFIIFELKNVIDMIVDGKVKVAEANARAEEAKLELKKLDTRA